MRSTQNNSSPCPWLFAALLTLTATAAGAAPTPAHPARPVCAAPWSLLQQAWHVLAGLTIKDPAAPADLSRGPLIDPDGGAASRAARPRTS
jgi:hypothetical protein